MVMWLDKWDMTARLCMGRKKDWLMWLCNDLPSIRWEVDCLEVAGGKELEPIECEIHTIFLSPALSEHRHPSSRTADSPPYSCDCINLTCLDNRLLQNKKGVYAYTWHRCAFCAAGLATMRRYSGYKWARSWSPIGYKEQWLSFFLMHNQTEVWLLQAFLSRRWKKYSWAAICAFLLLGLIFYLRPAILPRRYCYYIAHTCR